MNMRLQNTPEFQALADNKAREDGAFNNCRKLKEVIIPTQEVEINKDAFLGCDVTIKRTVPECRK